MDNIKHLRLSLSNGKTKYVIEEIVKITATDTDLYNQALALSSRFHQYQTSYHGNLSDRHKLEVEFNLINTSALYILEQLESGKPDALKRKKRYLLIACGCLIVAIAWFWASRQSPSDKESKPDPSAISAPPNPAKEVLPEKNTEKPAQATPGQSKNPTDKPRSQKGNVLKVDENNGNAVQNNNDGDVHQTFTIHPTPPKEEKNEKQ